MRKRIRINQDWKWEESDVSRWKEVIIYSLSVVVSVIITSVAYFATSKGQELNVEESTLTVLREIHYELREMRKCEQTQSEYARFTSIGKF